MARQTTQFNVTELEWLKVHLRLAALEQSGERLRYLFDFPGDLSRKLTCHIYFKDDDSNPISAESDTGREEIYEGWIAGAGEIMRSALKQAGLPASFRWQPTVNYILYESYGMGSSIVHTSERVFS